MKPNRSNWLSVVLVFGVFMAAAAGFQLKSTPSLEFPGSVLKVEVADTPAERQTGLSNRPSLEPGRGMIFVFDRPDRHSLWMKQMKFNLDLIWLDQEGKIISLNSNVAPSTYPASFSPAQPARYAVEVPAGYIHEQGLALGDQVNLKL